MRTAASHLRKMHLDAGEDHAKQAQAFQKLAGLFARAADALADDDDYDELTDCLRDAASVCNGLGWHSATRAEQHLNDAKSFSGADEPDETENGDNENGDKAARTLADLRKGVMDDHVSVVAPDAPVRPVFRAGMPANFVGAQRPAGDALENLFKLDSDLF